MIPFTWPEKRKGSKPGKTRIYL